jgi:cytochrome c2
MRKSTLLFLILLFFFVGCSGSPNSIENFGWLGFLLQPFENMFEPAGIGDVANGERLFKEPIIGSASAPGCITCHSLEPGVVIVGPSQSDVGRRAETAVPGMSAEEYLRQSIVEPNAHIAEGYVEGLMYQNFGVELTNTQINDLVAFMLTLK